MTDMKDIIDSYIDSPFFDRADAKRYRFLRSMLRMTEEERDFVEQAMHSVFPDDALGPPTDDQFDASIDAGMRAMNERGMKNA